VQISTLRQAKPQRVLGGWDAASAAGCHLNGEWLRNPPIELVPGPVDPARPVHDYEVTLTRPPAPWRLQVREDGVGTMIGLYALTCQRGAEARHADVHEGLLGQTKFVPLDSVVLRLSIDCAALLQADKHILLFPATFDKGKLGPFRIEASSRADPDFALRPYVPERPEDPDAAAHVAGDHA
jgi:hypothetical protein